MLEYRLVTPYPTPRESAACVLHTDKFVHVRTELSQGIKNHKNRANEKRLVTKGKASRGFKPSVSGVLSHGIKQNKARKREFHKVK